MATKNIKLKGFTIVELLIVIVVIGILAAITIVSYSGISARATLAQNQANAQAVVKAAESFRTDPNAGNGTYPTPAATTGTGTSSQFAFFNCTNATGYSCPSAASQSVKVPQGFTLSGQTSAQASSGASLPSSTNTGAILYIRATSLLGVCVYYFDPPAGNSKVYISGTLTTTTQGPSGTTVTGTTPTSDLFTCS